MAGRGFFRWLAVVCMILLALSPHGDALATQTDGDNGIHLYVYLENGAALTKDTGFPQFATNALAAMEAIRPTDTPIALAVFTLPKKPDDLGGVQIMPLTPMDEQGLQTLSQVMENIATTRTTDKNREQMRAIGLKTAYNAVEKDPSTNKRLLIFSPDDWSSHYDRILKSETTPVLFARMSNATEAAIPANMPWVQTISQSGLYTRDVPEWASKCYPFLFGEDAKIVRRYFISTKDKVATLPAYMPQLAARTMLAYMNDVPSQTDKSREPLLSDARLFLEKATMPEEWAYGGVSLPNGTSALLIDRFEPYLIRYLADDTTKAAVQKTNTPVRYVCQIDRTEPSDLPLIDDWQLSVTATHKKSGSSIQAAMPQNEVTGQYVGEIAFPTSGEYDITFQATSSLGVGIVGDGGVVQVTNPNPEATGQNNRLNVWTNSPVPLALPSIDLTTVFSDDNTSALRFSLDQNIAGIGIVDGRYLQADANLLNVSQATLTVTATDAEDRVGKAQIIVTSLDVTALLQGGKASVTAAGRELAKGDSLSLTGMFALSDGGKAYLDALAAEDKMDAFLALFKGAFIVSRDGQTQAQLSAKPVLQEDQIVFRSDYAPSPVTGKIDVRLNVSWDASAGGVQISSADVPVKITNKAPVCLQPKAEFSVVLPDILSSRNPAKDYEYDHVYQLKDFVGIEPGDVLTCQLAVYGSDMTLYRQSELSYVLTDQPVEDGIVPTQAKDEIVWDVTQPSPTLTIRLTKHSDVSVQLQAKDNDNAPMDDVIVLTGHARFENEATLILIGTIIAALLALIAVWLIIRQATKPKFLDTAFEVRMEQYGGAYRLPLCAWRKKSLTLRDIIQYLGLPITTQVSMRECSKFVFTPARRKQVSLYRGRGVSASISVNGATINPRQSKLKLSPDDAVTLNLTGTVIYITMKG